MDLRIQVDIQVFKNNNVCILNTFLIPKEQQEVFKWLATKTDDGKKLMWLHSFIIDIHPDFHSYIQPDIHPKIRPDIHPDFHLRTASTRKVFVLLGICTKS